MLPLRARATCSQHLHFSFFTRYKHREPNNAVLLSVCRHRCSDSMSGRCDVWTTLEDIIVSVPAQPVSANPIHLNVAGCHGTCPLLGGLFHDSSLLPLFSACLLRLSFLSFIHQYLPCWRAILHQNRMRAIINLSPTSDDFVKSHLSRSGLTNHQMWGKGL